MDVIEVGGCCSSCTSCVAALIIRRRSLCEETSDQLVSTQANFCQIVNALSLNLITDHIQYVCVTYKDLPLCFNSILEVIS